MNTTETLSQVDKELIQLYRNADESNKALFMDALTCVVAFGDAFLNDLDASIKQGNRNLAIATVTKWKSQISHNPAPAK